jgi:DNA-directed RNA polymerase specialized sigma subunit
MEAVQPMMTKKYSLSKNEIIAQEQDIIIDICKSVLANNRDAHLVDDLIQDINIILLTQLEETIQSLYETNQLRYFVARVVTNQVLSTSSPFHKTYRLKQQYELVEIDDYDVKADEIWVKAFSMSDEIAKSVIYLRFEYGLKISEISKVKGISERYVYKILLRSYEYLKKNDKK